MTVTSGSEMYPFSREAISSSNFRGVRPVACTSPTRGKEILPSERTGMDRDTSGSFQTLMAKTSSFPITNVLSCGLDVWVEFVSGDAASVADELGAFWAFPGLVWAAETAQEKRSAELTASDMIRERRSTSMCAMTRCALLRLCV